MKIHTFEHPFDHTVYTIRIGHNAQENWDLIDMSDPDDIWFHVDNSPSAHVVLKTNGTKTMPDRIVLIQCAVLCKQHSKEKSNKRVPIIYSKIKNVKKTKPIGSVICSDEKIIII